MARFILADNQPLTRLAFRILVRRLEPEEICEVEDKRTLIGKLREHDDYVVLLDYTLFNFTESENLFTLVERYPNTMWILVCDDLTQDFMHRIFYNSERISIVFKDSDLTTASESLKAARRGQRYICQRAIEVISHGGPQKKEGGVPLTRTEIEVLRGIAQGKTTREIAAERFSSMHTINTHRKNIFHKLKVNTAHEAVRYAYRVGLFEPLEFYI